MESLPSPPSSLPAVVAKLKILSSPPPALILALAWRLMTTSFWSPDSEALPLLLMNRAMERLLAGVLSSVIESGSSLPSTLIWVPSSLSLSFFPVLRF